MYAEETPNPLAMKFVLGKMPVEQGYYFFSSLKEVQGLPLLEDIFSLPGIDSVLVTPDFITITKTDQVPWTLLESILMSALQHHFDSFPLALDQMEKNHSMQQDLWTEWVPPTQEIADICTDIEELIETKVRPAIEADGGMITLCGFQEGVVYIKLQGACSSCPHSEETLKGGIEQTLKYYVPEITSVELVL
jgi:NFU1 iron-sulfur cluster scaffold homolog, mitochondrial